jgi:hypothetical protein
MLVCSFHLMNCMGQTVITKKKRMQQQTMGPWLDIRNISIAIAAAPAPHTSSVMGLSRGNLNRGGRWQGRHPPPEVCVRGRGQAPPPPLGMSAIWLPLEICLDTIPKLRGGVRMMRYTRILVRLIYCHNLAAYILTATSETLSGKHIAV